MEKARKPRIGHHLQLRGKITQDLVLMLRSWRHSGFQVFVGPRILPREEEVMEKLARYIIGAPRISRLKQSI